MNYLFIAEMKKASNESNPDNTDDDYEYDDDDDDPLSLLCVKGSCMCPSFRLAATKV